MHLCLKYFCRPTFIGIQLPWNCAYQFAVLFWLSLVRASFENSTTQEDHFNVNIPYWQKLVSEVFQSMWFTPVRDRDNEKLMRRVLNITSVISAIQDANYDFMEQLMKHVSLLFNMSNKIKINKHCCFNYV